MIAVMFEVVPRDGGRDEYLAIAASLAEQLKTIEGFVSIERFRSVSDPNKLLSLSFWRDERAIAEWRAFEAHRAAQARERRELFANYRLRVARVERDYGMQDRAQAPR